MIKFSILISIIFTSLFDQNNLFTLYNTMIFLETMIDISLLCTKPIRALIAVPKYRYKECPHAQMYLHRIAWNLADRENVMNIVVSNDDSVDPTTDYETLINHLHSSSSHQHNHSYLSPTEQKLKKKLSNKKLRFISKYSIFPKIKLQRKNWINFDTVSSSDSLNSVLQDYKIDYSNSHYNEKTNKSMRDTLNKKFMSPKVIKRIDTSLIKYHQLKTSQINFSANIPSQDDPILKNFKSRNIPPNSFKQQKSGDTANESKESISKINLTARKHKKYLSEIKNEHSKSKNLNNYRPKPFKYINICFLFIFL